MLFALFHGSKRLLHLECFLRLHRTLSYEIGKNQYLVHNKYSYYKRKGERNERLDEKQKSLDWRGNRDYSVRMGNMVRNYTTSRRNQVIGD